MTVSALYVSALSKNTAQGVNGILEKMFKQPCVVEHKPSAEAAVQDMRHPMQFDVLLVDCSDIAHAAAEVQRVEPAEMVAAFLVNNVPVVLVHGGSDAPAFVEAIADEAHKLAAASQGENSVGKAMFIPNDFMTSASMTARIVRQVEAWQFVRSEMGADVPAGNVTMFPLRKQRGHEVVAASPKWVVVAGKLVC